MADSPRLETATRLAQGCLLIALAPFVAHTPAGAAILAEYRIALAQPLAAEVAPAVVASGLVASTLHGVGGLDPFVASESGATFLSVSWPVDAFGTESFEIQLAPSGGSTLRLESMLLTLIVSAPMTFRLASSHDGFLSTIDQEFSLPENAQATVQLSLSSVPETNQPRSLRLFGYYDSDSTALLPFGGLRDQLGFAVRINGQLGSSGSVWDGGGTNNAWSTAANWNNDTAPVNDGTANLVFGGNVRLTPSVDTTRNVASITFNNTAGAFVIGGPRSVTIGSGGVTNNDADTQTITAAITLSASESFTAAAGNLVLNTVNIASNSLTVTGAHDVKLGNVTGVGTIAKTGAGMLEFSGSVGDGDIAVSANGGKTVFRQSQTLDSLSIGAGATVTLTAAASAFSPVPEPATAGLLFSGALALCGRRRGSLCLLTR